MGEAAPAQPAVGGFVSMLGVGMVGSMPGRVSGPIAASRGSAVPQLHSAIVERLRARIELCRRHHSTCESRYQRGQAETSDREHENTLHLLNLVHQSTGNRKIRGSRSVGQQSTADYNRLNGDQRAQNSETEPKVVTRNLVHGSLRRKIEGHPSGFKKNGVTCGTSGGDFKRIRVDPGSLQTGPCALGPSRVQNHPGTASMGHHLHSLMPHSLGSDLFNITLRDMKKEPVEVQTCGQASADVGMIGFDFKDEGGGQIDPELQELFDELTKSVPSLNDLEIEKILKQDDTFNLELGRPSSTGSTNPCPLLDRPIKTEYSPDFSQVCKGAPQLRPASAGPSFSMDGSVQMSHVQTSQGSAGLSRTISGWPELSHAEQLKQMAANQQQPSVLLHHPQQSHQNQNHQVTWPLGLGTHPAGTFTHGDKLPGVATMCPQHISPLINKQSKGRNNCLFKRNGFSNSNYTDLKVLNSKPMLQFTPKVPLMPQGKATSQQHQQQQQQQEQIAAAAQNKNHSQQQTQTLSGLHFQNQQVPTVGSQCLLPKGMSPRPCLSQHGPGMHIKMSPQQQPVTQAGPCLPGNSRIRDITALSQQQQGFAAHSGQEKTVGKNHAMQRSLGQQNDILSGTEKAGAPDQFSHHLTRPPPDYEQARIAVGGQPSMIYTGITSSQPVAKNSPDQSDLQAMPCPLPNSQASKMIPTSRDTFSGGQDPHQGSCVQPRVGQLREHQQQQQQFNSSNEGRMGGLHQNKLPQFQGTNGQSFATNAVTNIQPRIRTAVSQHRLLGSGLRGSTGGGSMESGMNWAQGQKQTGLDLKRRSGSAASPSSQPDMGGHHHFQQNSIGPPNQVVPHGGMPPLNSGNVRGQTSRTCPPQTQPRMPTPSTNLNPGSIPESVCVGPFPPPSQNLRGYQQSSSNSRAGQHTFDFLPEGDNTVPGVNTDSDFIDSLLKSGTGNDDWMKDINLEEILGGNS
ncbi:mastermind-like protein 2 isoform X2 [Clupea harengus]|uniref:Mastermind-like protein 2 isoform X2 n=1 Tax=Clupea harengus TaxID=7950 RepID=A0A6P3VRZ0_CLUHA|nr:mastermind-like protein 2 isoform X2 [Clupea harengus]